MNNKRFDLFNTSNRVGWTHYYVAHLMRNCGCRTIEAAAEAAYRETKLAKAWRRYYDNHAKRPEVILSDLGCVMFSNRWYITSKSIEDLDEHALEYWKRNV